MSPRVVLEPKAKDHSPDLYRPDVMAESVLGFDNVDDSAVDFYHANGYLLIRQGFSDELTSEARQELISMINSDEPNCESIYYEGTIREKLSTIDGDSANKENPDRDSLALGVQSDQLPAIPSSERASFVRKLMGFIPEHPPLAAIASYKPMMNVIERLADGPVNLFQDMAMIKPPRGREKPWHQDHAYFNLEIGSRIVAAWIALDEVSVDNGCMFFLAGGHKGGPRLHFMRRDWQLCDSDLADTVQTAAPMQCGDVLLFDAKLPHGTPTNNSDKHRWALQLHYLQDQAVETSDEARLAIFGSEGKNVTC